MASASWLNSSAVPAAPGGERRVNDEDAASCVTHDNVGLPQMSESDQARIHEQAQSHTLYIFRADELPFQSIRTMLERVPPKGVVDELVALSNELGYVPPITRLGQVDEANTPSFQVMHPNQRRGHQDRPVLHGTVRRGGQPDRSAFYDTVRSRFGVLPSIRSEETTQLRGPPDCFWTYANQMSIQSTRSLTF